MNDIDKMPVKCRDCAYWELATYPWYCGDCKDKMNPKNCEYIKRIDAKRALTALSADLDAETVQRCIEAMNNLKAADVEPKQKWISVKSDKPKEDGKCFVLRHSQGRPIVEIMYYGIPEYLKDRYFYFYDSEWGDIMVDDVTHWLPLSALPELPKEEDDGTCRTE